MSSSSKRASTTITDNADEPQITAAELRRRQAAHAHLRRGRIAVASSFGVVLIIAFGLVGFGYWVSHNKPAYVVPKHVALHTGGVVPGGIVVGGSGPVRVDMYIDYQCAKCKAFETSTAAVLNSAVTANKITLVYHPLALNDAATKTDYSTRAAASAACASDQGFFLAYSQRLFADEPVTAPRPATNPKPAPTPSSKHHHTTPTPKATPKAAPKPVPQAGLSDDQLVQVGAAAGIINPDFAQCLRAGTYDKWVANENTLARSAHITVAPAVLVNGVSIAATGALPTLTELKAAIG